MDRRVNSSGDVILIKYICNTCKKEMILQTMHSRSKCIECHNKYHKYYRHFNRKRINEYSKEYQKTKRWLNGTDNFEPLGEKIDVYLKSVNGVLKVKIK